ncbi:hypothetical protein Btru_075464 [Bulinus truncatus]|nr:hypothetical protein Btru_075464 [Bulinus truncatus]
MRRDPAPAHQRKPSRGVPDLNNSDLDWVHGSEQGEDVKCQEIKMTAVCSTLLFTDRSLGFMTYPILSANCFDDHIRCMAAKQRLIKKVRQRARQQKMTTIERLLDISQSEERGHLLVPDLFLVTISLCISILIIKAF